MFNQVAVVALRILLFRAGPQDFPYSVTLTRAIVALTVLSAFLQYQLTLPAGKAAVHAVATVAVLAAFAWTVLQFRGLLNRFQQTLASLFATDIMLTLVLLAPLAAIAPHLRRIAENPDLARNEALPAVPALAVMAISLWNLFVSGHIYRHALNVHFIVGVLVALLGAIITVSVASTLSALIS